MVERGQQLENGSQEFEAPRVEGGSPDREFVQPPSIQEPESAPAVETAGLTQEKPSPKSPPQSLDAVIKGAAVSSVELQGLIAQQTIDNAKETSETLPDAA